MTDADVDFDPQDGAEVLDETNLTEDGVDSVTFEEIDDDHVADLTQLIGDADEDEVEALDEDELTEADLDATDEDLEEDEDSPTEVSDFIAAEQQALQELDDLDEVDGVAALETDEVELEYAGDLMDIAGAESGAPGLESDGELSDADLEELGYKDKA